MAQTKTSVQASAPNFLEDEPAVAGYLLALRASGRADKTVHTYAQSLETLRLIEVFAPHLARCSDRASANEIATGPSRLRARKAGGGGRGRRRPASDGELRLLPS